MPSLKDLRIRINSVKSTQKITSAMKMVAAAKLRRAQEQAEAARPYAERMERVLGSLASSFAGQEGAPALLAGNGQDQTYLIIVTIEDVAKPRLTYEAADRIARRIAAMYEAGEFDVCRIIYNRFKSAMTQIVTVQQIIPFTAAAADPGAAATSGTQVFYEYEPDEAEILAA